MTVHLRHSKTDQEHQGRPIGIPFARDPCCYPVWAARAWLELMQRQVPA